MHLLWFTVLVVAPLAVGCSSKESAVTARDEPPPLEPADATPAPADAAPPPASPDAAVEPKVPDQSRKAAALTDTLLDKWAGAYFMAKGQWRGGTCAKGMRELEPILKSAEPVRDELIALLAKPGAVSADMLAKHRMNAYSQNKDRNFRITFESKKDFPCPRVRKAWNAFIRPVNEAWGDRASPPPWATPKP